MKNQELELTAVNITKGLAALTGFKPSPEWKLGDDFAIGDQEFIVVTLAQAKAYEEVLDRQGFQNLMSTYYSNTFDCLMVEYPAICIGIETDGYRHS